MRSTVFFIAALAMGALASPRNRWKGHRHRIVTETEIVHTTVTVYVTEGYVEPASTSFCLSATASHEPAVTGANSAPAAPPSSTPTPEAPPAPPAPTPEPEPEATSLELVSSPAPVPTPSAEPQPEPEPTPSRMTQASVPTSSSANHPSGGDQAYLSSGSNYRAAVLYHHNAARANHDAVPLTWDTDCEANARIAAQKCIFEHYIPEGAGQGQNLFTVSGDAFNVTAGITESWYKGELEQMMPYFGQKDIPEEVFHNVGHLTQMLWKGTTRVGCVSLDCGASMVVAGASSTMNKYTVCNYAPAGNVGGAYAENVVAPISITNLGGWAD